MAIKMSEFMKELRASRARIDPQEKLKQWQELKQRSQLKTSEKGQSIPKTVSPVLIVLSAGPKKKKGSNNKRSQK